MPASPTSAIATLVTSVQPGIVRYRGKVEVGTEYTRQCVESWSAAGFSIISVNSPAEAKVVRELGLALQVEEIPYSGPPLIRDMVRVAGSSTSLLMGIINSDCALYPFPDLIRHLLDQSRDSLILAERIDINPVDQSFITNPIGGFDAFFFRQLPDSIIADIDASYAFRLGDLWWDFWFPCVFLANGLPVRQCMLPLLSHLEHERNRKPEVYLRNGELFRRELMRLARAKPGGLLSEVLDQFKDVDNVPLQVLARGVHLKLWQSIHAEPVSCGPGGFNELEPYLYYLRHHHRWVRKERHARKGPFWFIRNLNHRRLDRRRTMKSKRLIDEGR